MERIDHPIPPLYDGSSRILILGSFPSVKSREAMFFYGHPQNRFWPVLAAVLGCERPTTIEEKKRLALTHHIALWDTIASCEIEGSSDSSIRGVVPNDLTPILRGADIRQIYCNGGTSYQYFRRYQQPARMRCSYGLLGQQRQSGCWTTLAVISPFSDDRAAVERLARLCTAQQLDPVHLFDVIHDFLDQKAATV